NLSRGRSRIPCRACWRRSASTACTTTWCWTRTRASSASCAKPAPATFNRCRSAWTAPSTPSLPRTTPRRSRPEDTTMSDLFKGELLRFRLWATAAAAINLVVLGFLSRMVDMAQQPIFVYQIFAAVYAVAGILLGLYQMGSYRKPNQWLNLLHRPLHRLRIAGALTGAGAFLLFVAVALPIALVALYQDTMTAPVVDLRHWL